MSGPSAMSGCRFIAPQVLPVDWPFIPGRKNWRRDKPLAPVRAEAVSLCSSAGHAAVDAEDLASDVTGLLRGEERHCFGDIARSAGVSDRYALEKLLRLFFVELLRHPGIDIPDRKSV